MKLNTFGIGQDPDPIRYAIIACLIESMPETFNFKLSKGMRRVGNNIPSGDWNGVNNPSLHFSGWARMDKSCAFS